MDYYNITDKAILEILGERLRQARINRNISQQEIAEKAGVSRNTVGLAEKGRPVTMIVLIQILRAMQMLEQLDNFLPEVKISPVMLADMHGKRRKRSSGKKKSDPEDKSEW